MAQWLRHPRPWLTIALAASVAFNVGLLGAGLTGRSRPQLEPLPAEVDGQPLNEALGMTPEQLERMQQERQKLAATLAPLDEQRQQLQHEIGRLIDADDPDRAAIAATLDDISALQRQTQDAVIQHHLALRTFLTSDQCRRFAEMINPPRGGRRYRGGRNEADAGGGGRGKGRGAGPPGEGRPPGFRGAPGVPGGGF